MNPTTIVELQEMVRAGSNLLPVGGGTKTALSTPAGPTITPLNLNNLSGILTYDPNEYTFTALAGTPLQELIAAVTEQGHYLPFDPLFVAQGATLGGTVAANSAGPGRYRYGGVRDFILGIRFIDGHGTLIRGGGQVVKNAAGFDTPKLMVGSMGRFGVLVELSFKVFPQPQNYRTVLAIYAQLTSAITAVESFANAPFDIDALDLLPIENGLWQVEIRLGGLPSSLADRCHRLEQFLREKTAPQSISQLNSEADAAHWQHVANMEWLPATHTLVKIPMTTQNIQPFDQHIAKLSRRYSAAGNLLFVATPDPAQLHLPLEAADLAGLKLVGPAGSPHLGRRKERHFAQLIKQAVDPDGSFLEV